MQFPMWFECKWLRPAPISREINYKQTCRKYQRNLCQNRQLCNYPRRRAGCSGLRPLWLCKGR
eukprot:9226610-Alexandrium_andersonii.AAC.1